MFWRGSLKMKKPEDAPSCFRLVVALLATVFLLVACATDGQVVDHSFEFDMRDDNQNAEVLDYRYCTSKILAAGNREENRRQGISRQMASIHGEILRGDSLYVKWRDKSTGQVHEETVDLRQRLP